MASALVNCNFPDRAIKELSKYATVIPLPAAHYLTAPMAHHPDMLVFVGSGLFVCHRKYYIENSVLIDSIVARSALKLVISDEEIADTYPHDAIFNACTVGKFLICNTKNVSEHILDMASKNGLEPLHVNQGYTKCSTLIVGSNELITSDRGIHAAAQGVGIKSLLIDSGNVTLKPYNYGFIGGASGTLDNKVFFCGNLDGHPDKERIVSFISDCGKECVFLPFEELEDTGSILFF